MTNMTLESAPDTISTIESNGSDVCPPRQDQPLSIFISHKHKDKIAAEAIRDELSIYGGGRLGFFLSEDIPFGQDWNDQIHEKLRKADWLLLIYSDPTSEWDWCLYESGFFAAKATEEQHKHKHRLICLHSAEITPPSPLKNWQSVKIIREDVVKLLKEIFDKSNPVLTKAPDALGKLAEKITRLIGPQPNSQPKKRYYTQCLNVTLTPQQLKNFKESEQVPQDAEVDANESSLRMFGLDLPADDRLWTWGEITGQLRESGQMGLTSSLERAMLDAIEAHHFSPSMPTFYSSGNQKQYLPVLQRFDRMPDSSRRFRILFTELPAEDDVLVGGDLGLMATLLRMARKFRWGIIDTFRNRISGILNRSIMDDAKVTSLLHELLSAIERIEGEATQRGFLDQESILQLFDAKEDKEALSERFTQWEELRSKRLRVAIEAKALNDIHEILGEMRLINKEFMIMASKRYHELLKAE